MPSIKNIFDLNEISFQDCLFTTEGESFMQNIKKLQDSRCINNRDIINVLNELHYDNNYINNIKKDYDNKLNNIKAFQKQHEENIFADAGFLSKEIINNFLLDNYDENNLNFNIEKNHNIEDEEEEEEC